MNWRPQHDARFWCEENAWHLCVEPAVGPSARVVVVSNPSRTVALWHQRAGAESDRPVIWDYHVIVVGADATVWDLDTLLGFPIPLHLYVSQTFRSAAPPALRPLVRVLTAAEYRARFASDRRHMRDADGCWQQPPPPWPAIGDGHRLDALLDFDDTSFGPWHEPAALLAGTAAQVGRP
jgi:protein N-terminal glutamine amidohydrolase